MKDKKSKIRCKKLPPHTYESHPTANAGEVKKPFVIAIIVVVAIISLSLLLLFSDRFVGKAFDPGAPGNAGMRDITVTPTTFFTHNIEAYIGAGETVAIGFTLDLNSAGLSCADLVQTDYFIDTVNWRGNEVHKVERCVNNILTYESGTTDFNANETGLFTIGSLNFNILTVGTYNLQTAFTSFVAWDLAASSNNLINSTDGGVITVQAAGLPIAGVYTTTITALVNTPPLVVYTILLGPGPTPTQNGPVLVIKKEKLPALAAGRVHTVIVNYPDSAQVESKQIIVYDEPADKGQTIYGHIADSVTNPIITPAIQETGITLK